MISLPILHSVSWWPTVVVLVAAALIDLHRRRIPNWLAIPFLISGIAVSTFRAGFFGLEQSFSGLLIGAGIMGIFYLLGGMGMGDVKLCAGVGAWIGPGQITTALVFTALAGGLMAVLWAAHGGFLKQALHSTKDLISGFLRRGPRSHPTLVLANEESRKMPYAPAIAIGTICSFLAIR